MNNNENEIFNESIESKTTKSNLRSTRIEQLQNTNEIREEDLQHEQSKLSVVIDLTKEWLRIEKMKMDPREKLEFLSLQNVTN